MCEKKKSGSLFGKHYLSLWMCDNGPQFIGTKITEFFQSQLIKWITSVPYHHVENGKTESTNKVIINNLKKRL